MEEEIKKFAEVEAKRIEKLFGKSNEEMILVDAVKLSEEVGEVMNEILNYLRLQRKEKLDTKEKVKENLASELADIVLVSNIIAKRTGIDLFASLKNKMDVVKRRDY